MPTPPNVFSPGTTIRSDEVNDNFALLEDCLSITGGTLTGTLFTQNIVPTITATYDLGSSSVKYRDGFFSRDLSVGGTLTTTGSGITAIPEANITDGSILARVAANETISGVWTITGASGQLTVSGAVPGLYVSETDATTNNKNWLIAVESELLTVQTRTDANAAVSNVLTVSRAGALTTLGGVTISSGNLNVTTGSINATASSINAGTSLSATTTVTAGTGITSTTGNITATAGGFREHGRSYNAGDSQPVGFNAGNFTAQGGGSWTVASGDQIAFTYRTLGDSMQVNCTIDTSTIAGTVTHLRIQIPGLITTGESIVFPGFVGDNTTNVLPAVCSTVSGTDYIRVFKGDFSNFTASTDATYVYVCTPWFKTV